MARLLLIEDDTWLSESYQRALADYEVTAVTNLDAALDAINATLPDVIVADFMLEGRNSLEFLHEIASYDDTQVIPVVLLSTIGSDLQELAEKLAHYGVVKICDKAEVTPASLRRVVQEAIASERHHEAVSH